MKRNRVNLSCKACNNNYEVQYYRRNSSRFCSYSCRSKWIVNNCESVKRGQFKNGIHYNLGIKRTPEQVMKMSKRMKGRRLSPQTEFKKGHVPFSALHPEILPRGKNHWKFNGYKDIKNWARGCLHYKTWRESVFKRDNYTCQDCGARNGNGEKIILNADHSLIPFSDIIKKYNIKSPEQVAICNELWDINNGRTRCIDCHKKTDTFGFNYFKIWNQRNAA